MNLDFGIGLGHVGHWGRRGSWLLVLVVVGCWVLGLMGLAWVG